MMFLIRIQSKVKEHVECQAIKRLWSLSDVTHSYLIFHLISVTRHTETFYLKIIVFMQSKIIDQILFHLSHSFLVCEQFRKKDEEKKKPTVYNE